MDNKANLIGLRQNRLLKTNLDIPDYSSKIVLFSIIIVMAVLFFIPFFIVITTSFKTLPETSVINFKLLPQSFQFINYKLALQNGTWGIYFLNSFYITVITVIGSLILNSIAGYSLARLKYKGRNIMMLFLLAGIMIPPQAYIIPQFIILRHIPFAGGNNLLGQGGIGWINSYWALIIPFITGSFGIFLCRQFYMTFPKALDEAAKIDGCSPLRTYINIYLPLSKPILATLTILKSVHTWNDFFYPLIMTSTDDMKTVQLALQKFRGYSTIEWNLLMAATVITILPTLIVFLMAQKYFIQGIVTSGIKG